MLLNLEELRKKRDLRRTKVELPDFEGHVFVQSLTAEQLLDLQKTHGSRGDCSQVEFTAHLLRHALCDEEGNSLCSNEDVKTLLGLSHGVFSRLAEVAVKASGLETTEKN